MPSYTVQIQMLQETVQRLQDQRFLLYAFKAVRSSDPGGSPVVWFSSNTYGLNTRINWTTRYEAFTSTTSIVPNGVIEASNPYTIDLGQTLYVTGTTGIGRVDTRKGVPGAIVISNQTTVPFTSGISQEAAGGGYTPICAFPLNGRHLNTIAPIEKVFLMFSSQTVNTGTVLQKSSGPGMLIDLTGASRRVVQYDINEGWNWDGSSWGKSYEADANLVPLLIESSTDLRMKLAEMQDTLLLAPVAE